MRTRGSFRGAGSVDAMHISPWKAIRKSRQLERNRKEQVLEQKVCSEKAAWIGTNTLAHQRGSFSGLMAESYE